MAVRFFVLAVLVSSLTACGETSPAGGNDSGLRSDGSAPDGGPCSCDDGVFCNGAETCGPSGCVAGIRPCNAGQACEEANRRCTSTCTDQDGDSACAPEDCDDSNPRIYPGNVERCDPADVDEDCNPDTYGAIDEDGDGANAARCCNVDGMGVQRCGDDCDDTRRTVNPSNPEVCDGMNLDNDCDPDTQDSVLLLSCYPDADSDGLASMGAVAAQRCACMTSETMREPSAMAFDCDETLATVNSLATETCVAGDQNCDGDPDPDGGCTCVPGELIDCGFGPGCVPRDSTTQQYRCSAAGTPSCPADSVFPSPDGEALCNNSDDDCDGNVDEGNPRVRCWADNDGDTFAPASAMPTLRCADTSRPMVGNCPVGFSDREPVPGMVATIDCNDNLQSVSPDAAEICATDTIDEDCDNLPVEGQITCYRDMDNDGYPAMSAPPLLACPDPTRAAVGRCPTMTTNRVPGATFDAYDCNDSAASIRPGTAEDCQTPIDEDCSCGGATTPSRCGMPGATPCWPDRDQDGYAAAGAVPTTVPCGSCPPMTTPRQPNPDDLSSFDCNDDPLSGSSQRQGVYCWRDADGDGRTSGGPRTTHCGSCPGGYTPNSSFDDCCDSSRNTYPGQTAFFRSANECGSFDYNCSGVEEPDRTGIHSPVSTCDDLSCQPVGGETGWVSAQPGCGGSGIWRYAGECVTETLCEPPPRPRCEDVCVLQPGFDQQYFLGCR